MGITRTGHRNNALNSWKSLGFVLQKTRLSMSHAAPAVLVWATPSSAERTLKHTRQSSPHRVYPWAHPAECTPKHTTQSTPCRALHTERTPERITQSSAGAFPALGTPGHNLLWGSYPVLSSHFHNQFYRYFKHIQIKQISCWNLPTIHNFLTSIYIHLIAPI